MVVTVPLTNGFTCLIDDEDEAFIKQWAWKALNDGCGHVYAARSMWLNGKSVSTLMHRLILDPGDGMFVDHIDGDGLNNQRVNLREVTPAKNQQNRRGAMANSLTGIRGVWWEESSQRYRAVVYGNGKKLFQSKFRTLAEAEAAVKDARRRYMTHSAECEKAPTRG